MKKTLIPLRRLSLAMALLSFATLGHAAKPVDDESDLPETLRSHYVGPIVGPANDRAYARGTLGLIRPSYGRASLYVAWRVMQLAPGTLATESNARRSSWLYAGPYPKAGEDEVEAWLKARGAWVTEAPAIKPDYYRETKKSLPGIAREFTVVTGQCGADAYAFATRTLNELAADTAWKDTDRRAWIAGQDAVFARCTWVPGTPAPALPAAPPDRAPAKLKALNAYQRATALFYGDDHAAARQAFDAIAAVPDHPMRPWAVLGALRSVVREAVRDAEWEAAVDDAWTRRNLRGADFNAALAEPAAKRNLRVQASIKEFDTRTKAALADTRLAPVHNAIRYTARRALLQLMPAVPLRIAMTALDRPDNNPYTAGAIDLFQELYPRVSPDRPEGAIANALRQHVWFDFIATIQGCSDVPKAPDAAVCDAEHAHALERWQEKKTSTWLLAALMTARQPSAADLPAAEAARAIPSDRPEWASLQFYAARVLRAQGRAAEARAALDALAASPVLHKRDRPLVEAERKGL